MWAGWVQQLECTLRVRVCVRLLKNYAVYAPSRLDLLYYLSFYACCSLVHEIVCCCFLMLLVLYCWFCFVGFFCFCFSLYTHSLTACSVFIFGGVYCCCFSCGGGVGVWVGSE